MLWKVFIGMLTEWKVDPSMIEYFPVAILNVLEAVEDVWIDGGLHFQPAGCPLRLEEVDGPQHRDPACLMWSPKRGR